MQGLTLIKRNRKALTLREGTKKDQKATTPPTDKNDKTLVICPL